MFRQRRLWRHLLEDLRGRPGQAQEQEEAQEPDQPDEPAQQRGRPEGEWDLTGIRAAAAAAAV